MGKRGFPPKPVELKLLQGRRSHHAVDITSTFRPEVALPPAPQHLSKEGRKAWKRLTPELLRYNLLSTVDRDALYMLCQTVGRLELVERSIAARQAQLVADNQDPAGSLTSSTPRGLEIQSVMYQVLNREMEKLRHLLAEFGLSPAQRARVTTAIRGQGALFGLEGGRPADPAAPAGFADFD